MTTWKPNDSTIECGHAGVGPEELCQACGEIRPRRQTDREKIIPTWFVVIIILVALFLLND
jgi:predicted nucleic acid-binding Zn ribbon protein